MNKSIKIFINYILGPLLFAWLVFSVYEAIAAQNDLPQYLDLLCNNISILSFLILLLVLVLMLMQWLIEALKWQLLLEPLIRMTILRAVKMIFTGISFSIATPNRVGEFIGRVLHLPQDLRVQATGLTFIGNFSQLIVTCLAGSLGFVLLISGYSAFFPERFEFIFMGIAYLSPALTVLFLFIYFKTNLFFSWVSKIKFLHRWRYELEQLSQVSFNLLLKILCWSALRYAVFIVQYWLLFKVIGLDVNVFQTSIGVSTSLFILSILPTISLVEIGLRWQISILVFAPFTANAFGLTMGVTLIWLINLIIPAMIGSLMVLDRNFSK